MADLSIMTSAQLNIMTKAQLVAAILEGQVDTALEVNEVKEGLGPIRRVEVMRDRLTGNVLGRRRIDWTYYSTGEVDFIAIGRYDAGDKETAHYQVKHFTDGRQPMVETS